MSRLLFGFMVTTAFISMWMSNTATAAMMTPIANAVLVELGQSDSKCDEVEDTITLSGLEMKNENFVAG